MVAAADLGPICVRLNNYSLTFEDGEWTPDYDVPDLPENASCIEQELMQLRKEKRKMKRDMDKFMHQAQEMKDLKERWNLLDFKYQLLLDMWTMRALDQKMEESSHTAGSRRRSHSASDRHSPTQGDGRDHSPCKRYAHSPKRSAHDSPPRSKRSH